MRRLARIPGFVVLMQLLDGNPAPFPIEEFSALPHVTHEQAMRVALDCRTQHRGISSGHQASTNHLVRQFGRQGAQRKIVASAKMIAAHSQPQA